MMTKSVATVRMATGITATSKPMRVLGLLAGVCSSGDGAPTTDCPRWVGRTVSRRCTTWSGRAAVGVRPVHADIGTLGVSPVDGYGGAVGLTGATGADDRDPDGGLLRSNGFRRLWVSRMVSSFGDSLSLVALTLFVADSAGAAF